MRTYRYLHYDVFTDRALEGNQLAVFPEPAGLTTDDMQRVTREMNFSECTYIFPAEAPGTDSRMRIFTPGEELPMAGHPTVGSTFALAHEGVIARGRRDFVFGLGVGATPVSIDWKDGAIDFVWMTQKNPEFAGTIADRARFAESIGLAAADLAPTLPEVVSCGNRFLIAPLVSRDAVDRVEINRPLYAACCAAAGFKELPLLVFSIEPLEPTEPPEPEPSEPLEPSEPAEPAVYSRMVAPGLGVSEDPATGSAAGPLGCYLFKHRLLPPGRLAHIVNLQGVKMLRPSRLHFSIDGQAGEITRVRVGGRSVLVGEGRLMF
jgi:trans-2,3-dihydro-3-hydroxyanthranilate isomerase